MQQQKNRIKIIGIGNEFRQDDALGLLCVRKLSELIDQDIDIVENLGEGSSLINQWAPSDNVILVDAIHSDRQAGYIHRFEALHQDFPAAISLNSSHAFSISEAINLAKKLDVLPNKLLVYGIEGAAYNQGQGLSDEVTSALPLLIKELQQEINLLLAEDQSNA